MTEQGKKVWKELEDMGWSGIPEDFHLEYFEDIIKATKKALSVINADDLINSLGVPEIDNEYLLKPDGNKKWWIEHKHVGSGEPLKQWLTDKPEQR
jgi:hypothetical protein